MASFKAHFCPRAPLKKLTNALKTFNKEPRFGACTFEYKPRY
jgi:hypothetical protein